ADDECYDFSGYVTCTPQIPPNHTRAHSTPREHLWTLTMNTVSLTTTLTIELTQQADQAVNNMQEIRGLANTATNGRDIGEVLKPKRPDPYDGTPEKLQGFLTQLKAYQLYYPTQFRDEELKVRDAIRSALKYFAEYRYHALRLDWNDEAHLSQSYLGLKDEVKDALVNINQKPTTFNDLARIAVEINDRQPVPGEKKINTTKRDEEPQMAIRTINMIRSGYDGHFEGSNETLPTKPSYEKEEPELTPEEIKKERAREASKRYYKKNRVNPEYMVRQRENARKRRHNQKWESVPEFMAKEVTGKTIAMVKKGKEVNPNPDNELSTEELQKGINELLNEVEVSVGNRDGRPIYNQLSNLLKEGTSSAVDEIPTQVMTRRPNRHHRDPNYASACQAQREFDARRLKRKEAKNVWYDKITPKYDEEGNQVWETEKQMYIELARQRADTAQDDNIYLRAYTQEEVEKPETPEEPI
ncbi:gag poly, partial [Fusarium beomiforme]